MMKMENPLDQLRVQIDSLDRQLLELLALRQQVVKAIGDYKKTEGLQPLDPARWQSVLNANMDKAKALGLCPEFIHDLYHLIHDYSLQLESETGDTP